MKTFLLVILLAGIAFLAGLPRRTCYQGNFKGYSVQVDTVTRFGRATGFVVLRPSDDTLPVTMGSYTGERCEFITLSNPHRFAAEPAKSLDPTVAQAWRLLERSRTAVAVDENIVRPTPTPLWVKFVPFRFLL